MSVIQYNDLFDFDGYEKALAKLETRKEKFAQKSTAMIAVVEKSYTALIAKVGELEKKIAAVNLGNPSSKQQLTNYTKATDEYIKAAQRQKQVIDLLNSTINLNEKSITELKGGMAALKKEYESLDPKAADFAQKQKAIADRAKEVNQVIAAQSQVLKVATKSVDVAKNSYTELSKRTGEMKAQLRAMPGAFDAATGALNKHNKAAVDLQRQIIKNDAALKRMDAQMGNYQRNVGNYGSAFKGVGSQLSAAIPMVLGVGTALQAVSESLQVIDRMERLSLSLEAASSSSEQFVQRQAFVKSLANQTGQDIEKLTQSYIGFSAATRGTYLEGIKADKIFSSFSKAFAALGTSSATAERGLMAIQQMVSKGKVSAEELRQQLGEALPGAMKLFADALGVSTAELDKMLKDGKVLATDVLPKVAEGLEKIYGDRAQRNLETMGGSWTNVTNQVKFFLDSLNNEGVISKFFSKINNGIAGVISRLTALNTNFGDVEQRVGTMRENKNPIEWVWEGGILGTIQDYYDASQQVGKENERILKQMEKFNQISGNKERVDAIMKEQNALKELNKSLQAHQKNGEAIIFQSTEYRQKTLDLTYAIAEQKRVIEAMSKELTNPTKIIDNPSGASPETGLPTKTGAAKRELTEYEKLLKSIEKIRDVLVDDALQDVKAGRAVSLPQPVLDKWKELYTTLEKVSKATGQEIPKKIAEFNKTIWPDFEPLQQSKSSQKVSIEGVAKSLGLDMNAYNKETKIQKGPKTPDFKGLIESETGMAMERGILQNSLKNGPMRGIAQEYKDELTKLLQEIQDLERKGATEQVEQARRVFNEKKRLAEEEVRMRQAIKEKTIELGAEMVNSLFDINSAYREREAEWNQRSYEHEMTMAGDNEQAKQKVKEEFARRDLELRQKQARADKAQALFNIGLSTAQSIMSVLSTGGGTRYADLGASAFTLSAIVGAIGAVQAAAVLAKPLPAFFTGTQSAPEGLATVAERGPELRESKGKYYYYETPQITYLNEGDKIYNASETSRLLAQQAIRQEDVQQIHQRQLTGRATTQRIESGRVNQLRALSQTPVDYSRMTKAFVNALDSRPVVQTIIDDRGQRVRHKRQNSTTDYLNRRFSL
jgi:tape measure domain-containing protein